MPETHRAAPRAAALALCALSVLFAPACQGEPEELPPDLSYSVPLQDGAYWPKFRRTAANTGYSPVMPGHGQEQVWTLDTGKGIFSAPVIDKEGTIYFGSANKSFYAVDPDGKVKWKQQLGELVDSAAVIGADGTVYVGSGDGNLYAFGDGGTIKWKFKPQGGAFITWFEGNVVIGPDGTLYAGNDDFHLYAIDPKTGKQKWNLPTKDQIWSAAGFGADGRLYFGCNDLKLRALDPAKAAAAPQQTDKAQVWSTATLGSVVSSPLVTPTNQVIAGSFDSKIYGHEGKEGELSWHLQTRDHIYASAAQAPDGTLYLPSADGTLYAFDVKGKLKWTFDTLEPIRSSPAVGGDGTIYFGCGDGRLYALNPNGTRRWSFDTSTDDRNDLNSSPALGKDAVVIAGEDGKLWSVPYDYCLRGGASDARCSTKPVEDIKADGAQAFFLTHGGSSQDKAAAAVGVAESVALRLVVRKAGDTVDAALDPDTLKVTATPSFSHKVKVSADGTFVVLIPDAPLAFDTSYTVRIRGKYLVGGFRFGNQVTGRHVGGDYDQSQTFRTRKQGQSKLPLSVAADKVPVLDLHRLAAPMPTMLPSYNQIGFDFMHMLVGVLELDQSSGKALAWVVAAKPGGSDVVVDPGSDQRIRFPLVGQISGDSVVFDTSSFRVEFAQVDVPIARMRIGATLDKDGADVGGLSVIGSTICKDVEFYGTLLRVAGLCNPKTDEMVILGTALLKRRGAGGDKPAGLTVQTPTLVEASASADGSISVTLGGSLPDKSHVISLLLLDPQSGKPYPVNYSQQTKNDVDAAGKITGATLKFEDGLGIKAGAVEVVVIHDLFPVGRFKL